MSNPKSSNVPDLVRIGTLPSNTAVSIETDVLDPVVHSDTFCRFQLQNKGIFTFKNCFTDGCRCELGIFPIKCRSPFFNSKMCSSSRYQNNF